ncbi:ThiF family adenylyltransferase [Paracoccus sp. WLY502]|uniref:ThiF family adenylyltransferase n=1 Tax=Paracoccus yibinensis TaxID=3068891 RepID=UPI002796A474|nr:ThiF family adenylyltransferase [Paracoccus sp. WLY502]MDQ1902358.1 ThiF family adenylyltransferase [Paracoccus sp. WLY502]
MTCVDLTLQEAHEERLRLLLARTDGTEAAAYVLLGANKIARDPWTGRRRLRLVSHEVVPIFERDIISSDACHISWRTDGFIALIARAKREGLVPAIVHTHPSGAAGFSEQDDRNEPGLHQIVMNRNGPDMPLASLLLSGGTMWSGRVWMDRGAPIPFDHVSLVGRRFRQIRPAFSDGALDSTLDRQVRMFGPEANAVLRGLRVAVVGCGGTGSAVAMLLARLGVGGLVLLDKDIVEVSNLNRLHGATRVDADAMCAKADVVAASIASMGLGVRAVPICQWVDHPDARDALKACDVVFGCTDDHGGRMLLDRYARFYCVPVIDVGLAIEPRPEGGFAEMSARVTVLVDGAPCLVCRGVVDGRAAAEEALKRADPAEYDRRKREAYVRGGGDPAPAVVTCTTQAAAMAVDELLQGITDFRGEGGWAWNRVRRLDRGIERKPGAVQRAGCGICGDPMIVGRGDVEPFLDRVS